MSAIDTGAAIGTMLTGLSAVTAAYVWVRKQIEEQRQARAARQRRNWKGYIMPEGIGTWYCRLVESPNDPPERVTLEVVNADGTVNPGHAYGLRTTIKGDGMISRSPTKAEWDFLIDMRKERGYGVGNEPIR